LVEIAIATLATDRALLLLGVPGTAKTWLGEHLAAAISGDSTLLVQGTAGTAEEAIRYGWNYASLLAKGPSREAITPSPGMRAVQNGTDPPVQRPRSGEGGGGAGEGGWGGPPRRGWASIWPRRSRAIRRCSCRARLAQPKRPSDMAGITPACWPRALHAKPSRQAR